MQRGELDGQARAGDDAATLRCAADRMQCSRVGLVVALRVARRQRGFAEHVVRVAKPSRFANLRALDRGVDRLTEHELLAEKAHRCAHRCADHRLADAPQRIGQRACEHIRVGGRGDKLAGDDQAPACGIDEQRFRQPGLRAPIAAADLVADQRIGGVGVGNAQQRFGEAHQRNAFLRGQRERLDQRIRATAIATRGAHLAGEVERKRTGAALLVSIERRVGQQAGDGDGLRDSRRSRDGIASRILRAREAVTRGEGGSVLHREARNARQCSTRACASFVPRRPNVVSKLAGVAGIVFST